MIFALEAQNQYLKKDADTVFLLVISVERIEFLMKLNNITKFLGVAVAVLALITFIVTLDANDAIDQTQAIKIAELKLAEFAKERGIASSQFAKANIRKDANGWEIYYEGVGKNSLLVNILVGNTGGSELHSTPK